MPVANFAALIENFEVKKTKHFTLLNTIIIIIIIEGLLKTSGIDQHT